MPVIGEVRTSDGAQWDGFQWVKPGTPPPPVAKAYTALAAQRAAPKFHGQMQPDGTKWDANTRTAISAAQWQTYYGADTPGADGQIAANLGIHDLASLQAALREGRIDVATATRLNARLSNPWVEPTPAPVQASTPAQQNAAASPVSPPTPVPVQPEPLIPAQDPVNPLSNALALGRALSAEYPPSNYGAADVAREAQGFGLGQQLNTSALRDEALRLSAEEADRAYARADEVLRNRYGGLGVSGLQQRRAWDLAQEFAFNKAKNGQQIRQTFDDLGFNRNLNLLDRAGQLLTGRQQTQEDRFAKLLSGALDQNRLQVETVQRERQRDHEQALQDGSQRYNFDFNQWKLDKEEDIAKGQLGMQLMGDFLTNAGVDKDLGSGLDALNGSLGGLLNPLANLVKSVPGLSKLDWNTLLPLLVKN